MDTVKLMHLCKISQLNRVQLDQLCFYNKKQRTLMVLEIILLSVFFIIGNSFISIPISVVSIGIFSLIVYERLTIKKKILSLLNIDSQVVCECRLRNVGHIN